MRRLRRAVGLLICVRFHHRWIQPLSWLPGFYSCKRCGEPGFWVETP